MLLEDGFLRLGLCERRPAKMCKYLIRVRARQDKTYAFSSTFFTYNGGGDKDKSPGLDPIMELAANGKRVLPQSKYTVREGEGCKRRRRVVGCTRGARSSEQAKDSRRRAGQPLHPTFQSALKEAINGQGQVLWRAGKEFIESQAAASGLPATSSADARAPWWTEARGPSDSV